ncbi:hypothetical protein GGI43DRAFT_338368 [Trichoderma evansii]
MKFQAAIAIISFCFFQNAQAICNSGEVGIGRKQEYQFIDEYDDQLIADNWVIAANNCNDIGVSEYGYKDDACSAGPGYGPNNGVGSCTGNDNEPGFVWTAGGNFHNCYSVSDACETGPGLYEYIYWCCQPWN